MTATPAPDANILFLDLTEQQRDDIRRASETRVYSNGDILLAAGAISDGVHFIEEGSAEVLSGAADDARSVRVTVLTPGQTFGELSALTGSPAISAVRAIETPVRLSTLRPQRLNEIDTTAAVTATLLRNVIRMSQQRLLRVNENYARQLEQTLELMRLRNASARLLILVIVLMCITILTNHWLLLQPGTDIYSPSFAWAALITLVLPTLLMAWRAKLPFETFGLTTRNLGRDLACSAAITVSVLLLGTLGLWLWGYPLQEKIQLSYIVSYGPIYTLHSALQEFMGRGVLLGMMLRIFDTSTWQKRQVTNIAVSLMFGLTHIHFGLTTVALMIAFSLLLGSYYLIFRNLAGPILIHAMLGISAFMLGLI
jgi:CRP-like cAMP-binding protein